VTDVLSQDLPERTPAPAIDTIEHLGGQFIWGAADGNRRPPQPRAQNVHSGSS